jgi:hypothetical protein
MNEQLLAWTGGRGRRACPHVAMTPKVTGAGRFYEFAADVSYGGLLTGRWGPVGDCVVMVRPYHGDTRGYTRTLAGSSGSRDEVDFGSRAGRRLAIVAEMAVPDGPARD